MRVVKVLIKSNDGTIEREDYIDNLEEVFPLESWSEDDVDEALSILKEDMPGWFASSDGKLHGYDFEILEREEN